MSFPDLWAVRETAAEEESHSKSRRLVHCLERGSQDPWAVPLALERSVVRTKQPSVYGQVGGLLGFICYSAKADGSISPSISERGCEN